MLIITACKQEGATYLLPPPRLLRHFGGPLSHGTWKKEQAYWEAPACPLPATVCVLGDATFSSIKKPKKRLGKNLF